MTSKEMNHVYKKTRTEIIAKRQPVFFKIRRWVWLMHTFIVPANLLVILSLFLNGIEDSVAVLLVSIVIDYTWWKNPVAKIYRKMCNRETETIFEISQNRIIKQVEKEETKL